MPKGKEYSSKTIKGGSKTTPKSVMGGNGKSAPIADSYFHNRPTNSTTFEAGTAPRRKK